MSELSVIERRTMFFFLRTKHLLFYEILRLISTEIVKIIVKTKNVFYVALTCVGREKRGLNVFS